MVARIVLTLATVTSLLGALRNRKEISSLYDLDDNQLRDIGLTRHDLDSAFLSSAYFEDPSSHLTAAASRRVSRRSRMAFLDSLRR
ncbi:MULTISPECIES: hypothetical protein [Rhizobium/Agrobacterium group]|jgi:uncharacterized protein YjiS (DUF1127 family)|uniref:hypothetical protein n=1 Tax=Rhizobium/Agrobacterium group TaxID=227290 RepID=UPI001FDF72BA|nr:MULTISPECIES: hypothetical protein [Rhizobium/Agrobacterium group]